MATGYNTDDAGYVLLLEALLHGARLVAELATSPSEPRDAELAVFQSFALAHAASVARPLRCGAACDWWQGAAPALVVAAHCALVGRAYEGVALAGAWLAWASPAPDARAAALAYAYLQLRSLRARSNVLRVAALTTLFLATFAVTPPIAVLLCVLGVELASWSTERHMLPWRVPSPADACGGHGPRFLLGFVVGVHVVDASREPRLLRRPRGKGGWLEHTVRGVAVHGDTAFVRYRAAPLGALLAYAEGLGVVPLRLEVERAGAEEAPIAALRAYAWGGLYVARVDVREWEEEGEEGGRVAHGAAPSAPLLAASRFPFRRLLLGLMLRAQWGAAR